MKVWLPPTAKVALPGETVMLLRPAALTVSVWLPLVSPVPLAVSFGLPALVSS